MIDTNYKKKTIKYILLKTCRIRDYDFFLKVVINFNNNKSIKRHV